MTIRADDLLEAARALEALAVMRKRTAFENELASVEAERTALEEKKRRLQRRLQEIEREWTDANRLLQNALSRLGGNHDGEAP